MKMLALIAAALLGLETAALACSCVAFDTDAERREAAMRIAANAAAIVDVELAEPMDYQRARPELYRVIKVHVGNAPAAFRLDRQFLRSPTGEVEMVMTSCDVVPVAGQRTTVVLYRSPTADTYRIGGTCDHLFVNSPGAIDLIRAERRKLERRAERG